MELHVPVSLSKCLYNMVKQVCPVDRQTVGAKFKIKVLWGMKPFQWMVRDLLNMIQKSGISCAFVCKGYPSQSFSIHQRTVANKGTLARGEQTTCFMPSSSQIQANKAFGWTTPQRRRTIEMLCSLLVCCVLLSVLIWPDQVYNITGTKSFHSLLLVVKDSHYTPSPIHATICSLLKQSQLDATR